MSDSHSFLARDAQGNPYRLTMHREMIGASSRSEDHMPSKMSIPVDIIGPRGEWVSLVHPGRYLMQPIEKGRAAIELFADDPMAL
ncbi:MAG: hypothetical protein K8U03_26875 [Planctomycetia bacterium]|nr:hypothetical protein [Planctomycetia bacterium]